jgi:hypothetical protein
MSNLVKPVEIKGVSKVYRNYRLKTKALPLFNQYFEIFYKYNITLPIAGPGSRVD